LTLRPLGRTPSGSQHNPIDDRRWTGGGMVGDRVDGSEGGRHEVKEEGRHTGLSLEEVLGFESSNVRDGSENISAVGSRSFDTVSACQSCLITRSKRGLTGGRYPSFQLHDQHQSTASCCRNQHFQHTSIDLAK
jgi:hypothetical protein